MKPSGVIYRSKSSASGEVKISLTKKEKKRMKVLRWTGANFASFAIAAVLFFYGPGFLMDFDYITSYARVSKSNVSASDSIAIIQPVEAVEASASNVPEPTQSPKPKVKEFSISIPAIAASSNVIEEVDPFDKETYLAALQEG